MNSSSTETSHLKHIYWRSRRGMLELELKLVPFVRDCYSDLDETLQAAYEQMLEEEDWQIFDWLQGKLEPQDPNTQILIRKISAHQGRL
ncbi:MAG: succinate dehydrogenase assembly factor 2 [Pseudomonadota bacterium]